MARSPSRAAADVDGLPSLLWLIVLPLLVVSGWYIRRWHLARRLRVHGIGKGAPGFQTNVARIRVTPEVAARLRRGEEVSPEEIQKAADEIQKQKAAGLGDTPEGVLEKDESTNLDESVDAQSGNETNEWLPDNVKGKSRRSQRPRRKARNK